MFVNKHSTVIGSANLRLGLASSQSPLVIPHVIAWQVKRETSGSESVGANVRVAVGEDKVDNFLRVKYSVIRSTSNVTGN